MKQSPSSNVAWHQLRDAYGSADEVSELLNQIAAGDDGSAWHELYSRIVHQGTIYEATAPVASWILHALQAGTIGNRMVAVGSMFGTDESISESSIAFDLLSFMAESGRNAVAQTGAHIDSGQTAEIYAATGRLVLEALQPGIPLYKRGLEAPDEETRKACAALIEAVAND